MDGEDRQVQKYRWVAPLLVVALIFGLLLIFGREFLVDPSRTAATRDPAWYTWRAGIIVQSNPGLVAGDWGPFHMFGGGYRVAVPVLGALMQGVGGTAQSSFPAFMMVGIPILAGLAFGAGAYRSTKSNLLYMLTMVLTGVFYLTTPYVGYLDNTFVLFVLAALIGFLEPARKSWGARSAVALLAFLAAYTHPTTCVVFLGTLFAVLGFHLLTQRFNFRAVLDRDLPALASVMAGMVFGLALWPLGKLLLWGTTGSLADAALPPPYTRAFFIDRLMEWVRAEYPLVVIPLIVVAVLWIRRTAHVEKKPADAYRTMTAWWLLPYVASIVFVAAGKVLPYYRFMNSTAAIMPLTAIGVWVLGMWLYKKTNRNKLVAAVSFIVLIAGLAYAFGQGIETSRWNDPTNQWIDQGTRAAEASVATIAQADPAHPIVFVNNYTAGQPTAYGWSKTDANVGRAGLPGAVAPRTFQFFGALPDFLAGQRTITNPNCNDILSASTVDLTAVTGGKQKDASGNPVLDAQGNAVKLPPRTDCTYDLVSRGFLDEMNTGVAANGGTPYVFMARKFNTPSDNSKYFEMSDADLQSAGLVKIGPDLLMVTGTGYSTPDDATLQKAIAAGTAETYYLTHHPKAFSDPAHLLRVLFGLFFLVALPGLLAARWFEVEGWQMKMGLVPPISLGINIIVAIAFISVTRSSFTTAHSWASVGVAAVAAGGLNLAARRRTAVSPGPFRRLAAAVNAFMAKGGQMIDDMAVPFIEKRSFRALMLTQFISMAGDGIVAGSVIKSISFGGASGFDPTSAKSPKDLLAIVFLTYLPFTLLSPFMGVVIDRFDRRKLLVVTSYMRAVLVAIAGFLLLTGVDATGILVVLALLVLAGFRLMLAIKGAGMPDAVDGKDLLVANSLSQAGGTIFQAGGAIFAVAGAIVAPSGGIALMAVACYAFAGFFARGIARLEATPHDTKFSDELKRLIHDTVAGIKEVASRPAAAIGLVSFQFTRMLAFGFVGLAFVFTAFETVTGKSKGTSKVELAIGLISAGIGAGIGLVLAQRWKDKIAPAKVAITAMLFAGGAAVLFAPLGGLLGRFLLNFFVGLGFFLVKVSADVMTQRSLPDDFRGRAYALFDIAYALSYAIPALVLWLAANAGISLKFVVAGAGVLVVLLALAMGGWAKKRHLYEQVSDDLEGDQIATGIES